VPGSDPRTAPDHTAAPLRHAGIRAVQDLGVRQTGDRAHQRPVTAPESVDPRLREHLDGLGQRLLAAHPPAAPTPATTEPSPTTTPPVATTVAGTRPAIVPPSASHGTHEVRPSAPSPAPPHNSRPVANPEPALTIDHLEVRVVVEPPPRQRAAPRPSAGARPAWTDSARRYLRNR
jgi:hypothetical protein